MKIDLKRGETIFRSLRRMSVIRKNILFGLYTRKIKYIILYRIRVRSDVCVPVWFICIIRTLDETTDGTRVCF